MLLEPLAVGLALAPSLAGAALALAAVFAFLCRHPLKLALADRRRGARYPRTALAERAAAAYASLALAAAGVAVTSAPLTAWVPLLLAAPLACSQLWYDARHQGRRLAPELLGGVALGSTAAAIAVAGGERGSIAAALWTLMALKAVTSVWYVRARLRLDRGQGSEAAAAVGAHVAALLAAAALCAASTAPVLAVAAFGVLAVRAAHGLSVRRPSLRPREIGLRELAYGVLTATLVAAGYLAGV
jgi:hypothetical protein